MAYHMITIKRIGLSKWDTPSVEVFTVDETAATKLSAELHRTVGNAKRKAASERAKAEAASKRRGRR